MEARFKHLHANDSCVSSENELHDVACIHKIYQSSTLDPNAICGKWNGLMNLMKALWHRFVIHCLSSQNSEADGVCQPYQHLLSVMKRGQRLD